MTALSSILQRVQSWGFLTHFTLGQVVGYVVDLAVLLFVVHEVRVVRKHQRELADHAALLRSEIKTLKAHERAIEDHRGLLESVRPLTSHLYTDTESIMGLAVESTREASQLFALGTLSCLSLTERRPGEQSAAFEERRGAADPTKVEYVKVTRDIILKKVPYRRILNLIPRVGSDESYYEALANVAFFRKLMEDGGADVDLKLFHNSEVIRGKGDFHFRCTNEQVILRVGGHGNPFANAAVKIVDAGVAEQFMQYFESLLQDEATISLDLDLLSKGQELLEKRDIAELAELLGGDR